MEVDFHLMMTVLKPKQLQGLSKLLDNCEFLFCVLDLKQVYS